MPLSTHEAVAASAVDELPQLWDGFAKLVRTGLDITAFGVQIPGAAYTPSEWTAAD